MLSHDIWVSGTQVDIYWHPTNSVSLFGSFLFLVCSPNYRSFAYSALPIKGEQSQHRSEVNRRALQYGNASMILTCLASTSHYPLIKTSVPLFEWRNHVLGDPVQVQHQGNGSWHELKARTSGAKGQLSNARTINAQSAIVRFLIDFVTSTRPLRGNLGSVRVCKREAAPGASELSWVPWVIPKCGRISLGAHPIARLSGVDFRTKRRRRT